MASGKHASNDGWEFERIPWKKIIIFILIMGILVAGVFGGKKVYSSFISNVNNTKTEKKDDDIVIKENMPNNLYGYKVLGKITIETKNYSGYILEAYDNTIQNENNSEISEKITDALKKGLVRLYGDKINEKGNFTIIGHNEDEYFSVLSNLSVGESFMINTVSNQEKKYIITEIKEVEPTDLNVMLPNKEYTEVTLITCTSGSNKRLVVKALEETDYEISKTFGSMTTNNQFESQIVEENIQ